MPRIASKKKRKPIDEDVIYAGTGYEEPEDNEKRRSRRINKAPARPKGQRKRRKVKREKENIIGGELICPHPECKNKIHISERGCKITTCTNIHAHGGSFFYFCCHCKVGCQKHLPSCKCEYHADIGSRKKEQEKRNEMAGLNPIDLTIGDEGGVVIDHESSGESEKDSQGTVISDELGSEGDGATTSGRSSFSGTSSSPFSLPSSSPPTDDETDENNLKPPAKSGIESQIHARNDDDNDIVNGRESSDNTDLESQDLSHELGTVRGGPIPTGRFSLHVSPALTPPSSLPSSSRPADNETKHPDTVATESEGEDDVIRGASEITHSATEYMYQAHPDDAVSINSGTLRLQEGTSEVSHSYEAHGNDGGPITDDHLLKSQEGHDDGDFGGIGIVEDATDRINQDIGDDDYFPPSPPLPGQVVELRNASLAHTGNKRNDERWNKRLGELRDYKKQKGHCNFPATQGQLGTWVSKQRSLYRKREAGEQTGLTDERVVALEAIGFQWDGSINNTKDEQWSKRLGELREYKEENGHCNVPKSQGPLGRWVKDQRSYYRKKKAGEQTRLTDERVMALDAIDFEWDGTGVNKSGKPNDEPFWNSRLDELREYKKQKGNCNVPQRHGPLGKWVQRQRYFYKKRKAGEHTTLTDERVAALDAVNFEWDGADHDALWNEKIFELREYKEENGHCNVPQSQGALGKWVSKQRLLYRKKNDGEPSPMTDERFAALDAMGFQWDGTGAQKVGKPNDELWNERLGELRDYKTENGNCNVPMSGGRLGRWVAAQRSYYQKRNAGEQTCLTDERVGALNKMGFEWDGTGVQRMASRNDERWKERLNELREYKEENGHCIVPQKQGPLGRWVNLQRFYYRKRKDGEQNALTDERITALDAIGFEWTLKWKSM